MELINYGLLELLKLRNLSDKIKELVPNLHCLKINSGGEPAHPLYLKANLKPIRFI